MEELEFTTFENKAIGRNIAMYRKVRGMKALEVAEGLGLKENSYTRYERGEAAITVDIIRKIAEILNIDPLVLVSTKPGTIIDAANSPYANVFAGTNNHQNYQTYNEKHFEMMAKLTENLLSVSQELLNFLKKQK